MRQMSGRSDHDDGRVGGGGRAGGEGSQASSGLRPIMDTGNHAQSEPAEKAAAAAAAAGKKMCCRTGTGMPPATVSDSELIVMSASSTQCQWLATP